MDPRLRHGIELFNEGRFFESHEAWEPLYLDTEDVNKPFVEALIQLAAAFRLFRDFGEVRGATRMIYQALIRFENYQPAFLEVRVTELSEAMEAWATAADAASDPAFSRAVPKIPIERFPFS